MNASPRLCINNDVPVEVHVSCLVAADGTTKGNVCIGVPLGLSFPVTVGVQGLF